MPLWFKLAIRELQSERSFTLSFILNLCLGLVGFLTIDAFKVSIDDNLSERSRSILAADLGISSKTNISKELQTTIERNLPEGHQLREEVGLFTMASSAKRSPD